MLAAAMSAKMSRKTVSKILNITAIVFGLMLIFLSLISCLNTFNYTFALVGCFLIISVVSGSRENSYKRVLSFPIKQRKLKHGIMQKNIVVPYSMSLVKVYSLIDISAYFIIHVVDENFTEKFKITETEFLEAIKLCSLETQIGDIHIDKLRFDW